MFGLNKFEDNGSFVCGDLKIRLTGKIKKIDKGQTINGVSCLGTQKIY